MEKGGGEEHYFQIQQNNDNEKKRQKLAKHKCFIYLFGHFWGS